MAETAFMYPFMGFMYLGPISGEKVPELFHLLVYLSEIRKLDRKLRKIGPKIRKSGGNYVKPIGKSPFPGGKYI